MGMRSIHLVENRCELVGDAVYMVQRAIERVIAQTKPR
jgi:hypothetical protein